MLSRSVTLKKQGSSPMSLPRRFSKSQSVAAFDLTDIDKQQQLEHRASPLTTPLKPGEPQAARLGTTLGVQHEIKEGGGGEMMNDVDSD